MPTGATDEDAFSELGRSVHISLVGSGADDTGSNSSLTSAMPRFSRLALATKSPIVGFSSSILGVEAHAAALAVLFHQTV